MVVPPEREGAQRRGDHLEQGLGVGVVAAGTRLGQDLGDEGRQGGAARPRGVGLRLAGEPDADLPARLLRYVPERAANRDRSPRKSAGADRMPIWWSTRTSATVRTSRPPRG